MNERMHRAARVCRGGFNQGALAALIMVCVACTREPAGSTYTVEYYLKHQQAREEKLAECANDPGAPRDKRLCANARAAAFLEEYRLRDLPSLELERPTGRDDADRESSRYPPL